MSGASAVALPNHEALVSRLTDLDGRLGLPADQASSLVVTGGPSEVANRVVELAEAGAEGIVVTLEPECGTAR